MTHQREGPETKQARRKPWRAWSFYAYSHFSPGVTYQFRAHLEVENPGVPPGRRPLLGDRETSRDFGVHAGLEWQNWRLEGPQTHGQSLPQDIAKIWSCMGQKAKGLSWDLWKAKLNLPKPFRVDKTNTCQALNLKHLEGHSLGTGQIRDRVLPKLRPRSDLAHISWNQLPTLSA